MRPFRDLPIRRKLTLFIMLASCLALTMAIIGVLSYELVSFKARAIRDLAAEAEMIRASTKPALDFNDPTLAQQILDVLRSEPEIVSACIYQNDGKIIASYARSPATAASFPPPREDSHAFIDGDLVLFRRITSGSEKTGTVYLRYDLALAYARVPHYLIMLGIVAIALIGLSLILSNALQRIISAPILRLARTAQVITDRKDYSVRAEKESGDEIGQLTDTFNEMLAAIAIRDKALQEAKGDLENRVRDRTASLQESLRSLEGVLYHVAHDLRAPLRAMQGFTSILLEQYAPDLDSTGKEFAGRISAAAVRMDLLIQDLLEYGRLGHVELILHQVDLNASLSAALNCLASEIASRKAEIKIDEPLPGVWANAKVLEQILINILGNALKFVAPDVIPLIHISAEVREQRVRLSVQDNGIGIEPEHHERIFRVFERLHPAEFYPGTGIGLAIVRKGMERMGGHAGLESKPGQGSCFWLDLATKQPNP